MYEQESVCIINEIIKVCLIVYVQNEVHFNTIIWEKKSVFNFSFLPIREIKYFVYFYYYKRCLSKSRQQVY